MKILISLILTLTAFAQTSSVVERPIDIEAKFIPKGLNSGDKSIIYLKGELPNQCNSEPQIIKHITGNQIHLRISAIEFLSGDPMCPNIPKPFEAQVDLGVLDPANYSIFINEGTRFFERANLEIVEDKNKKLLNVITVVSKTEGVVTLLGLVNSNCYQLKEVNVISNNKNTYTILPVMEKIRDFCPMKRVLVEQRVELPEVLNSEEVLVHVKSQNGNYVSMLINNQ